MLEAAPLLAKVRARVLGRKTTSPGEAPLFSDVRQVCSVVEDFETTVGNLVDQLGIGPFRCWHFRPPRLYQTTFRGRPERYSMKLALTWLDDVQWEVITPVDGRTMYRDHLEQRGRGVQHLLMSTGDVPFEAAAARLAERGHPFGQTAKLNAEVQIRRFNLPSLPNALAGPISLEFGYVDAEATLRTNIELTRYPLGFSERFALRSGKPERTIPENNPRFERPLTTRRVGRLFKITTVTRDLDATLRAYVDLAGVGPWRVSELGPARLSNLRLGGERASFSVRAAWAMIGNTLMELVEPRDGKSPYHDVLGNRGEGVMSLAVLPGRAGFDPLIEHCRSVGYTHQLQGGLLPVAHAALLGARKFIGTDLEVLAPDVPTPAALFDLIKADRTVST